MRDKSTLTRFTPRQSVMSDYDSIARYRRAERIARIRARLADGWRHMAWESRLAGQAGRLGMARE